MSASEAAGSCIAVAVGILLIAPAAFDVLHKRRTRRRFQVTARAAARRTEADVQRDLAKTRAALDLTTCLAIWEATKHDIPHQTRRTEEDR